MFPFGSSFMSLLLKAGSETDEMVENLMKAISSNLDSVMVLCFPDVLSVGSVLSSSLDCYTLLVC